MARPALSLPLHFVEFLARFVHPLHSFSFSHLLIFCSLPSSYKHLKWHFVVSGTLTLDGAVLVSSGSQITVGISSTTCSNTCSSLNRLFAVITDFAVCYSSRKHRVGPIELCGDIGRLATYPSDGMRHARRQSLDQRHQSSHNIDHCTNEIASTVFAFPYSFPFLKSLRLPISQHPF